MILVLSRVMAWIRAQIWYDFSAWVYMSDVANVIYMFFTSNSRILVTLKLFLVITFFKMDNPAIFTQYSVTAFLEYFLYLCITGPSYWGRKNNWVILMWKVLCLKNTLYSWTPYINVFSVIELQNYKLVELFQ